MLLRNHSTDVEAKGPELFGWLFVFSCDDANVRCWFIFHDILLNHLVVVLVVQKLPFKLHHILDSRNGNLF